MNRKSINRVLLEGNGKLRPSDLLDEASVRLPPRSTKWVAAFTGPVPGKQIQKSTELSDREAALALAQKWERQAKAQRLARKEEYPGKPSIRARGGEGLLTQQEVAALLRISVRAVREIERRAFEKLKRHPKLQQFWREYGGIGETAADLSAEEISALFFFAETPLELMALQKTLRLIFGW
jgi:DNA-binding transcriptional regulator YiaG